jgi:ketosteroid isomerase-like protein
MRTLDSPTELEELADLMRRRAGGQWDALGGRWADTVVVWHCYDNKEVAFPGNLRGDDTGAELTGFERALKDFSRRSSFHVSESTNAIVETSRWSGVTHDGQRVENATCIVYSIDGGRISRLDIYDDSNRSRVFAELLVHHLITEAAGR